MLPGAEVWLPALLIALGVVGIVVPVLPGLPMVLAGVLLWAIGIGGPTAWVVFGTCLVLGAAGWITQLLIPGRRLKAQGISTWTLVLAVLAGIVGFFVVPVLGAPLGFVLAILVVEFVRVGEVPLAWQRTGHALKAVVLSWGIELAAALLIALTWVTGVLVTQ